MKVATLLMLILAPSLAQAHTHPSPLNKDFTDQVTRNVQALNEIQSKYGEITFDTCDDSCTEQKPYIESLKKLLDYKKTSKITLPNDLFKSLCACLNYYFETVQ